MEHLVIDIHMATGDSTMDKHDWSQTTQRYVNVMSTR